LATYAVGDLQGCLDPLKALLDQIEYAPERDRLWFAGDVVNRGPQSLESLRFVRDLGDGAVTVLGNHDLNLLAVAAGVRKQHRKDTLAPILEASDRDELLNWLRRQPVMHRDEGLEFSLVHAGLPPQWDLDEAQARAMELEIVLRGDQCDEFFTHMYGDGPAKWKDTLEGWERIRFITNCFTRMRYCDTKGRLSLDDKGPLGSQARGLMPWFEVPERKSAGQRILFGHWAALNLPQEKDPAGRIYHLDSGCVWGERLTALRLEDRQYFSVSCAGT